jgi:hypothetical protein
MEFTIILLNPVATRATNCVDITYEGFLICEPEQ